MQDERQLADAMTAAAKELQQPVETAEVLDRLVQVVLRTVPGADFAGVSVGDRLGVHTMASTHSLVDLLDRAQYDLQEGPCLDAMRDGGSVAVDDLRATRRWPRFAPQAVKHGVLSQLGVEIYRDASGVGGLNLYASAPHAFDEESRHAAELFVVHAAHALDKAATIGNLTAALRSRQTIGQAVGITMQRFEVDESTAFRYLARISQQSNIKLREVAQQIVDDLTARARSTQQKPS
jgi:GAF domain-containing protein